MSALTSFIFFSVVMLSGGQDVEYKARGDERRDRKRDLFEWKMRVSAVAAFQCLVSERREDEDDSADYGAHENFVQENARALEKRVLVYADHSGVVKRSKRKPDERGGNDGRPERKIPLFFLAERDRHIDERDNEGTDPDSGHRIVDPEVPGYRESRDHSDRTQIANKRHERKRLSDHEESGKRDEFED